MERRTLRGVVAFTGTGIAILSYALWLGWPPSVTIPTPTLPSPNGHDVLAAAANLQVEKDAVADAVARVPVKGHHLYTLSEKEALVRANAAALNATRKALSAPYWNPPVRSVDTVFPELAKFRVMARILALDAQVKSARGDYAGAVNSLLDADEIGIVVPRGGSLIADLVGIACEAIGDRALWRYVDSLDAPSAEAAARRLEALIDRRFPYAKTLQEEKWSGQAIVLTELKRVSTMGLIREFTGTNGSSGAGGDDNDRPMTVSQKAAAVGAFLTHSRSRIFSDYTKTMEAYAVQADTPFTSAQPTIPLPTDPLNESLIPILHKARFKDIQIRMQSSMLLCALALRCYKMSHGAYPASLADLVAAGILKKVPDDPFANTFSTPFRYQRISAGTYLLYSVGPDGMDDGGRPIDLAQPGKPPRYYAEEGDKGDWVVGADTGN